MNIELHLIQNFAPSNLNRSDTGTPKECEFGGVRRARVSSQCFKRAVRDHFKSGLDTSPETLAQRSKRLHKKLTEIAEEKKLSIGNLEHCIEALLSACGIFLVEEENQVTDESGSEKTLWIGGGESETLAFLGEDTLKEIVSIIENHSEPVSKAGEVFKAYREEKRKGDKYKGSIAKEDKKKLAGKVKTALGKDLSAQLEKSLDGSKAADLALFGRMLADLPESNVDAACQVAHAISTHKVGVEFDFYTAVDDLLPTGETGAGMMGTIEFNSACFYRYANIDVKQLKENLGKDDELTYATIEAFIRSMIHAIPTGKQNSMAAQNLPSFILAVVRPTGFWSLANAFVNPVKATDIVAESIKKLDEYWGQLATVYGGEGIAKAYVNLSGGDLTNLNGTRQASINALVAATLQAVKGA
jgi:CRISPR system Cascade subunit CasC